MTTGWLKRLACLLLFAALAGAKPAVAQDRPITLAIPGIPPVFGGMIALVAEKEGFFRKHGVNVEVKAFETGAAASRAVVARQVELALSPTPLIISQVANASVPLVGIWGMEFPDWLIGSMDPNASCQKIKGQAVGVDSVGGARSIALRTLLGGGCKMKIEEVQQIALSSNVGAAMVAGQLQYGVLHVDDIPVIEAESKKKVKTVVTQGQARAIDHYLLLVVHQETAKRRPDALVRVIAGLIESERFMRNPANHAKVAQHAAPTGRKPEFADWALKAYLEMEFWPHEKDGLTRQRIEGLSQILKNGGAIKPGKEPAPYDRLIDASLWPAAHAMVGR